jgi:AraC-like DNA-binding protein
MKATEIAASTRLSVSYLNCLFRSDGKSMMDYLWKLRLEKSARLLASGRSARAEIEEIAWQCGFSSASHFTRRFRAHFGVAPREFRAASVMSR